MEQKETTEAKESGRKHHHHHHSSKKHRPIAHSSFSLRLTAAIWLNVAYVSAAIVLGYLASSIGVLSDSIFTLANVFGITVALFMHRMSVLNERKPKKAYRYRYLSIYLRIFSLVLMLLAAGGLGLESLRRLFSPMEEFETLDGELMLYVALGGVVLHALTAFFLMKERKHNSLAGTPLAFWLSTLVSAVTAVGAIIVLNAEDDLFDNIAALFGAVLMLIEGISVLYPQLRFSMGGATDKINRDYVTTVLKTHANVRGFGHMHIMALNRQEMALMVHVALFHPEKESETRQELKTEFYKLGIQHVSIEVSEEYSKHG